MSLRRMVGVGAVALSLLTVAAPASGGSRPEPVRVLGEYIVPKGVEVDGLPVGGLSGIDYRPRTGEWVLISDDTGQAPARFYTAELDLDRHGLHGVALTGGQLILRRDGSAFPPASTADPELADRDRRRGEPLHLV